MPDFSLTARAALAAVIAELRPDWAGQVARVYANNYCNARVYARASGITTDRPYAHVHASGALAANTDHLTKEQMVQVDAVYTLIFQ